MKLHHIGFVCYEKDLNNFFFSPKKRFTYFDKIQKNKIIIGKNKLDKIWYEFIIPINNKSTVYKYLKKNGNSIHHLAYKVNDLNKIVENYKMKQNFTFINKFKINIPCFGGKMKTAFFFNNNIFIEFLKNESKSIS